MPKPKPRGRAARSASYPVGMATEETITKTDEQWRQEQGQELMHEALPDCVRFTAECTTLRGATINSSSVAGRELNSAFGVAVLLAVPTRTGYR